MTHSQLVEKAVRWLRHYRCGLVLSEQACVSGEMPDAIGWKRACHSVLVECKVTRADFLADRAKPFRLKQRRNQIDHDLPRLSAIWIGNAYARYGDKTDTDLIQSGIENLLLG